MSTSTRGCTKPDEFDASGESPPSEADIPPALLEELAEILAEALVEEATLDLDHS